MEAAHGACRLHACTTPSFCLLDEPTAGVDPKARRDFWDELQGLAARGISVLVSTHYMDEASRCHKLAYIAYGKLLAQGSAAEVIAGQHLSTWAIYGDHLIELQDALARSTRCRADRHLRRWPARQRHRCSGAAAHRGIHGCRRTGLRAEPIDTSLEDVFIYMMSRSSDNFGGEA